MFNVIDFYNSGAQVQVPTSKIDMTHSFGGGGDGEPKEIGYEPKANSKLVDGPSHDMVEYEGARYLLLKKGHVYEVELVTADGKDNISEVISAEEDHVTLALPASVLDVEVEEYEETAETPNAPETATAAPEAAGTLGTEGGGDDEGAADTKE